MVRYPVGGIHQWMLGWLVGLQRLGHEVYLVEKSGWPRSCYDLSKRIMTDDCSYGVSVVNALLERFALERNWCFVDASGHYHGLPREHVQALFKSADLFIDHEGLEWLDEAADVPLRVFVDGEPGWYQIKLEKDPNLNRTFNYTHYYTDGTNIGTDRSCAPTGGREWRHLVSPVLTEFFPYHPVNAEAPFTTVMNWNSHKHIEFQGVTYRQKEAEFAKFIDLPRRTPARMEIAVSGSNVPWEQLKSYGWNVRDADDVTVSIDSFRDYILASKGTFTVAKHVFVATNSGMFAEREAYYMATGRPAVVEETGFSAYLPVGRGLFAVRTVEEAANAIDEIMGDFERHSRAAHEIAIEFFDAPRVLGKFLKELGV
jgi:hypothetical protein